MNFVQEIRATVKRYEDEGLGDVAARERLVSEREAEIGADFLGHAEIILRPIIFVPEADLRLRCGVHDKAHRPDDPEFGWPCIGAMARALSLGINMTSRGELE